jgi:hypothetical protein
VYDAAPTVTRAFSVTGALRLLLPYVRK